MSLFKREYVQSHDSSCTTSTKTIGHTMKPHRGSASLSRTPKTGQVAKLEDVYLHNYETAVALLAGLSTYFEFYNNRRFPYITRIQETGGCLPSGDHCRMTSTGRTQIAEQLVNEQR
jgi:hypothetical protein